MPGIGSSITWSRTSTTSSTSERGRRVLLALRVIHPFPSVLDGVATFAIAMLAGGEVGVAIRLGVAMTAIQAAIGAANDLSDASRDAGRADKPIPAGLVTPGQAVAVAAGGLVLGLALAVPSGPATVAVAGLGAVVGLTYDLRLKGTAWAPLAYAIGIPLLPVFAWLGATGALPAASVVLLPAAGLAGASLAIGNALVDVDRDRAAGVRTPATALGSETAWRLAALLQLIVAVLAVTSVVAWGVSGVGIAVLAAGGLVVVIGLGLARSPDAARRERGWQGQAIGIALAAVGWLAAVG